MARLASRVILVSKRSQKAGKEKQASEAGDRLNTPLTLVLSAIAKSNAARNSAAPISSGIIRFPSINSTKMALSSCDVAANLGVCEI